MATLAVLASLMALQACDPGVYEPGVGDDDAPPETPDAALGSGAMADGGTLGPDAAALACETGIAQVESGEHNPGQPCQLCHGAGGDAPRFTLGGTLYTSSAGTARLPGATIVVIDANNVVHKLPSAQNGNFWTTEAITFPVTVHASLCPDTRPMISPVADGDCNAGGCHDSAAPSGRIHLP